MSRPNVGIVVATRNRREPLLATLGRLSALPERPPLVLVDNGSDDGTPAAVRTAFPGVLVLEPGRNLGSAARTLGVRALETPYVAFSDDDSWWARGALARAADVLDRHPRLAVLAARILVGPEEELDPTCAAMARSPLPREPDLPGPAVLGFVACGAVVRRRAYLEAGGFSRAAGIGGEEELLALDLAARGWAQAYVEEVVAHHHPAAQRDEDSRRRAELRNRLRTAWLRRQIGTALRETGRTVLLARHDPAARAALTELARGAVEIARHRRPVPRELEQRLAVLDDG